MKKKILAIVIAFILILPFKVKASNMDSYIDWNLDRSVFAHQYRNGEDHITNLAMITANGKIAYCIEPGVTADKGSYYSSTTNINDTKLTNVDTKRLSLIGYYGYGYPGHDVKEYYMATQELIWRQMGVASVWWTDAKTGGNTLNIEYYKNEILRLVNEYEKAPKFNFEDKYLVGDEVILDDQNNVLNGYEITGNDNVSKDGNKIKIKVMDKDNSFTLRRKVNNKVTKFYYKDGYQTIGSFEFPYNYEQKYNIDSTYGKIIVNKYDDDTKSKEPSSKEASLEGALYGLYDSDDNLIDSKTTNKDGNVIFDNLPKGDYVVKEIKPSNGYTIDETVNKVFLKNQIFEITIESYEKIIKNMVIINKVLDDTENKICIPEEGIIFHIYDDVENFIKKAVTDKNGNITLELPYGKYVLRQESTLEGVDKVEDRIIEINEDGITQNIVLVNHRLEGELPKTIPEEVLPNTGKNSIALLVLLISFCLIGILYEKKFA